MAADFSINDSPFADLLYEAEHDEVLTLQLEDSPGLDAERVRYSVVIGSEDAPELTFSPSTGVPTTPTGTVTVTMPSSGTHSYILMCEVNEGKTSAGRTDATYTRKRLVAIRSENLGLRKQLPGETTEAHAAGWTVDQNRMVDILDAAGGGGGGGAVVSATLPLAINSGVLSIAPADGDSAGSMSAAHYAVVEALGNVDVEPTAETIVQRGTEGQVKADFLQVGDEGAWPEQGDIRGDEDFDIYTVKSTAVDARVLAVSNSTLIIGDQEELTPELRSAANEGIAFRHGASLTTYARLIPTPAQVRDLAFRSNGRPRVYSQAIGSAEDVLLRSDVFREYRHTRKEDSALLDEETTILSMPSNMPLVLRRCMIFPEGDIALDFGSNYAEFRLESSDGSTLTSLASISTDEVELVGFEFSAIPASGASVAVNDRLQFTVYKRGTGKILPKLTMLAEFMVDPAYSG
jgi:hypothetical protein